MANSKVPIMKKRKLCGYLCLFIMISSALAGCYTKLEKSSPHPSHPMPPPGHPIVEPAEPEVPDSLVQVSLYVNYHSVCRSDPIEVRVSVTNHSDQPVMLGNGACPVFFLVAGDQDEYKAYIWGRARKMFLDPRSFYLDPGESCSKSWPWEALVRQQGRGSYRVLEPGDYILIGTAGHYRSSPVPVTVVDE